VVLVFAIDARAEDQKTEERVQRKGVGRRRKRSNGEILEKPYPRKRLRKGKSREMRRESANAKKINRPRQ